MTVECSMGRGFCGDGYVLVGLPPLCRGCYLKPKVRHLNDGAERIMLRWMETEGVGLADLCRVYGRGVAPWITATVSGKTKKKIKEAKGLDTAIADIR